MKVRDLMDFMEGYAPVETAEPWDNVGLLVGSPENTLTVVYLTVDVTKNAIAKAKAAGASCILSHHPLLFNGTKTLRADDYEGSLLTALIRENIALYAAHTNLDKAKGGVADCLAAKLGQTVTDAGEYLRVGTVKKQTVGELYHFIRESINPQAVLYGEETREISRIASACGAGGEFAGEAADMGAEVFITGEMKHHERLEAQGRNMEVILCGHEESERWVLEALNHRLKERGFVLAE